MRLVYFLFVFSILCSCMPNVSLSAAAAAETNVANLIRIQKGMTQAQVLKIMRHPYSDTVFVMDKDIYDVWFYVTDPTVLGQSRMVPLNLTPLTFKNGILIGRGYPYYNYLKRRQMEKEMENLAPPVEEIEKPQEFENKPLENLLKESVPAAPSKTVAPPQAPQAPNTQGKKGGGATAPSNEPSLHLSPTEPKTPAAPTPSATSKGSSKKGETPQQTGPNWGPIGPQSAEPEQPSAAPAQAGAKTSKKQGGASPSPTGPNWGPLEPETQPVAPPPGQESQGSAKTSKKQGEASPSPTGPNWGPLEPETQPVAPPPGQESQGSGSSAMSMSKQPETSAPPPPQKKPEKESLPLNEEDEEMLQEEREQDFDQT